ncbi:MAG: serine/threonine-protein kinase [Gemmatimonadales bacterium]
MSVTSACNRCQTPLDSGARFCQVCGLSVSGEQTAPLPTLTQVLQQATLGEYEVLREIGQGGMATVFLAHEIALARKVAIKVMSPQLVHGADMIERFKREARTAASLNHPHIIPIYAVRESQHLLYFVMKYVQGRPLDGILRDVGPLPFPMVRSILSDIGSALDYAHRQGVIHRDVKPGNILIDEEGFAVITDFGIAKAAQGETLTRSGTTVGTPSYLSPEACSGEATGPAADQYSLGIVGYEMITGQLPFSAESSLGMMYAQVHAPPRPSEHLRPDCPRDLRDSIMRMLEKAPADRFPTLKEAVAALSGARISGRTGEGLASTDEHVRSHIGLLAVPRPGRPAGEARATPASPAPLSRVPPSSRTLARQRRVQFTRILGGLFLAGLGAIAAILAVRGQLSQVPVADTLPPPRDTLAARMDSLLIVARGRAEYAREVAVTGGASPAAIAAGDSIRKIADSLAALGQKPEAAVLLERAANLWSVSTPVPQAAAPAESAPPRRPGPAPAGSGAPAVAPRPGTTQRADSLATASQPVPDSVAAVRFYLELQQAIRSRQLGEVRRLLPNMTESEERDWRGILEDDRTSRIEALYEVRRVSRTEEVVYARVKEILTLVRQNGKIEKKRDRILLTQLTLGPQGWRQIRAEKAP